jgi:addiction module HigA family antidote
MAADFHGKSHAARARHALRIMAKHEPRLDAPHPGRVLHDCFLWPFEISQNELARHIRVPPRRINEIVLGKRAITADTAVRLAAAFATSPRYWMRLQADYDIAAVLRRGEPRLDDSVGYVLTHNGVIGCWR